MVDWKDLDDDCIKLIMQLYKAKLHYRMLMREFRHYVVIDILDPELRFARNIYRDIASSIASSEWGLLSPDYGVVRYHENEWNRHQYPHRHGYDVDPVVYR